MKIPRLNDMPYEDLLEKVIADGLAEVAIAYADEGKEMKLRGAIAGFELMRGKSRDEIKGLADATRDQAIEAFNKQADDYWFWRLRAAQTEWVLNVINAADYAHGRPTDFAPTSRGYEKAASILGPAA